MPYRYENSDPEVFTSEDVDWLAQWYMMTSDFLSHLPSVVSDLVGEDEYKKYLLLKHRDPQVLLDYGYDEEEEDT